MRQEADQGGSTAARGLRTLAFGTVALNLGRLALLLGLSRLVAASDFGLLSVVSVVVNFSAFFADAGISNALYQAVLPPAGVRASLFWLNVLLGAGMGLLLLAAAPWLADFYRMPDLHNVLFISVLGLVCTAAGAQHRVLLRRDMRFSTMFRIEALAFAANAALSLAGAWMGHGVYALAAGTALNNLLTALGYVWVAAPAYRPIWHFRVAELRPFWGFGLYQMGERILNYLAERADALLIGKLLGAAPLGLYDVLKQLLGRPESIVNPVVAQATLPVMARRQADAAFVRRVFLRSLKLSNTLNFGVCAWVFCAAEPFLQVVLGSQWAGEALLLRWLALFFMLHAAYNPFGALQLAKGRVVYGFWWNLVLLLLTPVVVFVGAQWGTVGVAQALCLFFAALAAPFFHFLLRPLSGASWGAYADTFRLPLAIAVCSGAGGGLVAWSLQPWPWAALPGSALVFSGVFVALVRRWQPAVFRLLWRVLRGRW